jgi:nucleolar protein 56
VYVAACVIGLFATDKRGKLIAHKLFPARAEQIASRLRKFEAGETFGELRELASQLKKRGLAEVIITQPNPATEFLRSNFRRLAIELKFVKSQAELNALLSQVGVAMAKAAIAATARRDRLIIQAVSALADLDRILNTMSERLREWYGLHYPEFKPAEHERFAKAVAKYGAREKFEKFVSSMGMSLSKADIEILRSYAVELLKLYEMRARLEEYLGQIVPAEMPNTTALLGPVLAARLLSHAGSLEKLAKMPSSAIQLLGAERALFRALRARRRVKIPKYGVLFSHPDISSAKKELKGKTARLLAAKLTIAVRTDFFTKEDRSAELLADYKRRLEEIRAE